VRPPRHVGRPIPTASSAIHHRCDSLTAPVCATNTPRCAVRHRPDATRCLMAFSVMSVRACQRLITPSCRMRSLVSSSSPSAASGRSSVISYLVTVAESGEHERRVPPPVVPPADKSHPHSGPWNATALGRAIGVQDLPGWDGSPARRRGWRSAGRHRGKVAPPSPAAPSPSGRRCRCTRGRRASSART